MTGSHPNYGRNYLVKEFTTLPFLANEFQYLAESFGAILSHESYLAIKSRYRSRLPTIPSTMRTICSSVFRSRSLCRPENSVT